MGSIVEHRKVDKTTGKEVTVYRAHIRRRGFASKSKLFDTRTAAKEWLRNNESDDKLTPATAGNVGMTLSKLVEAFTRTPPSKGTKYWVAAHLDFWIAQLGSMKVRDIAHGDINGALAILRTKQANRMTSGGVRPTDKLLTPGTVNRYLASLASVLNYALDHGIIDEHPMKGGKVKKLTESQGRSRILTEDEMQRLLEEADAARWPLMGLYLRMMFTTAARKSEVLNLRWRDIDLERRVAVLPKTKNGEARALPLVAEVRELLEAQKKVRPLHSDFVFYDPKKPSQPKNIDTTWQFVRQRAGVWKDRDDPLERVVLHSTRHTGVTKMLRGGANLAQVARVSGHKTLAMLKRYEHLAADDAVDLAERLLGNKSNTAA